MKRFLILFCAVAALAISLRMGLSASIPADGKVYATGYGSNTVTTLQSVLSAIGSFDRTVVLSGGPWAITTNITIPANIALEVQHGSYMDVSAGSVVTGAPDLVAGDWKVFDGAGNASGFWGFGFRFPVWGDTNRFNIGLGSFTNSQSLNVVLGNGHDAGQLNATNFALVQGATGEFNEAHIFGDLTVSGDLINTNRDINVSYHTYPRITLTTNMFTAYSDGGTTIPITNMIRAIDGTNATSTVHGILGANNEHAYICDLGEHYEGFFITKMSISNIVTASSLGSYMTAPAFTGGSPNPNMQYYAWAFTTATGAESTNMITGPFAGRYLKWDFNTGSGTPAAYRLFNIMVYGLTNSFNSTGGW